MITIDPQAKFSDGNPVTAEDVKYSYDLYLNYSLQPSLSPIFMPLERFIDSRQDIHVINDSTISFKLTELTPYAFDAFTLGIIEKSLVEPLINQYGAAILDQKPFSSDPVGTALITSCGPFVVENITKDKIILSASQYYHRSKAKVQHIILVDLDEDKIIDALKEGSVHIVDMNYVRYDDIKDLDNIVPIYSKTTKLGELSLNLKHPYFGTGELTPLGTSEAAKNIRKAISHLMPREMIVNTLGEELAVEAGSHCPDGSREHDIELKPYTYSLEQAKQLMEKAGFSFEQSTSTSTTTTSELTTQTKRTATVIIFINLLGLSVVASIFRKKWRNN